MWLIVLKFIKSDLGKKIIIAALIILSLISAYYYIFNKGRDYQKDIYQAEYIETMNKIMIEHKKAQEIAYKKGLDMASKEEKIVIKYVDRKVQVEKIVEKYKECKMSDTDFNLYLKELRDLK
jgi:hypothetical protein